MDVTFLLEKIVGFYHDYTLLAIVLGVAVLIWAYLKPKQALKGVLFLCFIAAVFYLLALMRDGTGAGLSSKERMMHKTEQALE